MPHLVPRYTRSSDASTNPLYIVYVILLHFALSIHHGWIDSTLQSYRTMYQNEDREAQRLQEEQVRLEQVRLEQQRQEEEARQQAEDVNASEPVVAPEPMNELQGNMDEILFGDLKDDT